MGRQSTGAKTIHEGFVIDLSYLRKHKLLDKGQRFAGSIDWSRRGEPTGSISFETNYLDPENIYLRLAYKITNNEGEFEYDYKIQLVEVPSNLGKGNVLYFICPQTSNKCRKLYRTYASHKWKSREAYSHRIYYSIQLESKQWRANTRYFQLDKILYEDKRRKAHFYNGKETKRSKRHKQLFDQYCKVATEKDRIFTAACKRKGWV